MRVAGVHTDRICCGVRRPGTLELIANGPLCPASRVVHGCWLVPETQNSSNLSVRHTGANQVVVGIVACVVPSTSTHPERDACSSGARSTSAAIVNASNHSETSLEIRLWGLGLCVHLQEASV